MTRYPIVKLLIGLVLGLMLIQFLMKTTWGQWLLAFIVLVGIVIFTTLWFLRKRPTLMSQLYAKSGWRQLIDFVCWSTQEQKPTLPEEGEPLALTTSADFRTAGYDLRKVIRGHNDAIMTILDHLEGAVRLRSQKLTVVRPPPIAAFLLVGPEGVGKKYLAAGVSRLLFSAPELFVLDLRRTQTARDASTVLFGGGMSDTEGQLTSAARRQPYHAVILEGIETASADLQERLTRLVKQGHAIDDGTGKRVSFENCVLFFTTSQASGTLAGIAGNSSSTGEFKRKAVETLTGGSGLDFPFLAALTDVVHCGTPSVRAVAEVVLMAMVEECRKYRVRLEWVDPEIVASEVISINENYGYSMLQGRIERLLKPQLVAAARHGGSRLRLTVDMVEPEALSQEIRIHEQR